MPDLIPLVVLRGSGPTTAALSRHAAERGVQVLAHAEGGGVLYVDRAADPEHTLFLIRASLDRLGVCNRLNVLLVHREIAGRLPAIVEELSALGVTVYGSERARRFLSLAPLAEPLGHEWANDPERVNSISVDVVESVDEAYTVANRETSALAASIVTEDSDAAEAFLNGYRGTAAFWQAPTRFTDGAALMGIPETGINVGWAPGPARPSHLSRPLAETASRRRRRNTTAVTAPTAPALSASSLELSKSANGRRMASANCQTGKLRRGPALRDEPEDRVDRHAQRALLGYQHARQVDPALR